jgi:hypothetical protein
MERRASRRASARNLVVERAVHRAIDRIDYFLSGGELSLPSAEHRRGCEDLLERQRASVRVSAMFFIFYWLEDENWDRDHLPAGLRGQYGDKFLSEELNRRHITLHDNITAFAENLGWKGDVGQVRLATDSHFRNFLAVVGNASPDERGKIGDFFAYKFAESRRESQPLPPVGPDVLTFVRAKVLFYKLLETPSEGHIPQFLVAALLHEFRRRHAIEVITHHPHAADAYDETAGDIEEKQEGRLVRAYEVTMRPDWQHRISGFQRKMDRFGLSKYIIIASGINDDEHWAVPARMALSIEPHERDIAVVDIHDIINFLAAELTPLELRSAVNMGFEYLSNPRLSGREDLKDAYREVVREWLDTASQAMTGSTHGQSAP